MILSHFQLIWKFKHWNRSENYADCLFFGCPKSLSLDEVYGKLIGIKAWKSLLPKLQNVQPFPRVFEFLLYQSISRSPISAVRVPVRVQKRAFAFSFAFWGGERAFTFAFTENERRSFCVHLNRLKSSKIVHFFVQILFSLTSSII